MISSNPHKIRRFPGEKAPRRDFQSPGGPPSPRFEAERARSEHDASPADREKARSAGLKGRSPEPNLLPAAHEVPPTDLNHPVENQQVRSTHPESPANLRPPASDLGLSPADRESRTSDRPLSPDDLALGPATLGRRTSGRALTLDDLATRGCAEPTTPADREKSPASLYHTTFNHHQPSTRARKPMLHHAL